MSDEKKQKTLSPFMERFLISILGTTISIALTFGTTALVNSHKKKAAQKQTAMLVIHDIDNTIESMEATKNQYEKYYESAQYFLEYMDHPEAAAEDDIFFAYCQGELIYSIMTTCHTHGKCCFARSISWYCSTNHF